MEDKIYRVIDIITMSTDFLKSRGFENARLNAELIAAHVLKMNRVQLYLNFEKQLSPIELAALRDALKRRAQHEPIQYLTGETEFFSLKLSVNKSTLIPRPETELLVETVLNELKANDSPDKSIQVLDIGTGSGNIAIALAKHLENSNITALDIGAESLAVARLNAEFHQVHHKIEFFEGDIFQPLFATERAFDAIVSNPPYITDHEFHDLPIEVRNYEPAVALKGGTDGTLFYHRIAELARTLLKKPGFVAVEIGATQKEAVQHIFAGAAHFHSIEVIYDLNKLPRVILAKLSCN
ncbi:MAG: peptide chain release factor N(5)-glutamine methyltransferase [Candidatus Zhuqueibacterota bacterium]